VQVQAPPAAVLAGENFTAIWVTRGPGWLARLRPVVTAQLAAQFNGQSPAWNPATRVTGPATVTSRSAQAVNLSVPTDAGPALVTVSLGHGQWLASSVMLARTGN
jgi:hypothetical protein